MSNISDQHTLNVLNEEFSINNYVWLGRKYLYFLEGHDFNKLVAISQEKRSSLSVHTSRT